MIVVGGGPAGTTAAYEAAKEGLRTIILEKDRDIGFPVRCGEAVGEDGLKELLEIDSEWIATTIKRVKLHSPKDTSIEIRTPGGNGLILNRKIFDYALAQRAANEGAEVLTRAYVDGLHFSDGHVNGVKYQHDGENHSLTAKIVIGADGVESRVGRMAGLRTALKLGDTESGYQVAVDNVNVDQDLIEFYVGKNWAPGGYLWVFPKGEGNANIGLAVGGKYTRNFSAKNLLDQFLQEHFPSAHILTAVAGGIPVAKTLKNITTNGLMLTGDAARMVNPISGGGITSGMIGGRIAGQVAVRAIRNGDYSTTGLKAYPSLWHKEVGRNHERIYRISKSFQELTDDQLEKMARELEAIPAGKLNILKVFKSAAKHKPKILLDITRAFTGL